MLGSSLQHHHRNMSFPHGGTVIHNNMPPTVSKKMGSGRLNAVVNKLHLAKQCTTESSFPDMVSEQNHLNLIKNLLHPTVPPPSTSEKKNLRAPPALFPLTSEVTIQRYPVVHPANHRPLDVFQRLKRLGTDIEMEDVRSETTLTAIPISLPSQNTSVSCIPTTHNLKTNNSPSAPTSLIVLPNTNVFNNKKIPEPSVVLEVKVSQKQKAQNICFNNKANRKNYVFSIDQSQVCITNNGQKHYSCNVCSSVYQRRGALKKHYLKAHINYHYLTNRDLQIAGFKGEKLLKMIDQWRSRNDQVGYYHCHKCYISFSTALELRCHVLSHPPMLQSLTIKKIPEIVNKVCELCLYCDKIIENEEDRKSHLSKMHPPKRRNHMCAYCQLNFFDLYTLHKHMCVTHEDIYYGCPECKERFISRELSKNHKTICLNNLCIKLESENNDKKELLKEEPPKLEIIELKMDKPKNEPKLVEDSKKEEFKKKDELKINDSKKEELKKKDELKINDSKKEEFKKKDELKINDSKNEELIKKEESKKEDPKKKEESRSYPFYCPDCKKGFTQQPNLARHMSLGHGKKLEYKKSNKLLQSNKLQTLNKVVLPKKAIKTQEKELKDEIQDLSARGTQYVFLNNKNELVTKHGIPFDISYMNLETQNRIRRMLPSLNPNASPIEDDMTSLEVEAASSYGFPSAHDSEREKIEGFSGEWLYPRNYICSACPVTCSNIWDIFYHKWNVHPNVLCHHYDIPLDQLPSEKWRQERNLNRIGLLSECDELNAELPQCTKCGKAESDIAQLHRHLLDCGGDTEWLKTMIHTTKSPNSKKSRKNWRPFNFRRRKNGRARHGLKRTPPTPPLPVVKTKPGDAESVSRMIADLPPKRVTRRLVFEAPNGNNQATINSVPIDMSSRNLTVSNSTTFSKKIKKILPPVIPDTAMLISEVPDFLRSLNIMRAPPKPTEHTTLPCSSKTETEEIIAAMKKTLMASPAPTPVILPKKRKRPIYDFKQLAEKIAKHDHNKILDPKIEEINDAEQTVPVPVATNNKHKQLLSQIEIGLIQQNRLRRKRVIPSTAPGKTPVPPKKAKIEIQEKNTKIIKVESNSVKKTKNVGQAKKKTCTLEKKIIDENFVSKIQTRNRKKTFIEESLSNGLSSRKKEKSINNNESSNSSFIDVESSQEMSLSEVPSKKTTVKVNPFKSKSRNRRTPGVFFGSRKRKTKEKKKKINQSTSHNIDDNLSKIIPSKSESDRNSVVSEQIKEQVLHNCIKEEFMNDNINTGVEVQEPKDELETCAQTKEREIVMKVDKENKVAAPISIGTTDSKEPEEVAEPRWHGQSDAFFDLPSTISLGSILSSVNQILEGPDSNVAGSEVNDYSWTELQRAMGATDEEMAILQNFGSNSSQGGQDGTNENDPDLMDLDCKQDANCDQEKTDPQVNSAELNFKCKVCDQCYKGVAAFRIHSLDVHGIEDPELVDVIKSDSLLVCWVCKLIMQGGPEELDEHMVKDHEFDDAPNSENGKELKNKMVSKLGEILDQALKNLISSTQKPSADKTWSGGAITLLGKLCALRNNENSSTVSSSIANSALAKDLRKVIGRNNGSSIKTKKTQSAHAIRQNARLAALSEAAQRLTPMIDSDDSSSIYKCPICNIGFETTSTRNKHISRAHNNPKRSNRVETAVVKSNSSQQPLQPNVVEETPTEPSPKVPPMFSLGAMNRRGLKKFNSTCSEEVRARAKQALRDLEIKSRLKHYTFSGDNQSSPN